MDESAYSTLTESEKRKQAKHYVSKDNFLYYVGAKGETRRVVRETEKHIGSFVLAILIVPLVKEAGQIGPKPNRPQVKSAPVKSAPSQIGPKSKLLKN